MTESRPSPKPSCSREDALAVLMRLREAGHEAYFAGGCVRDLLMGGEPKDWDVATDAPPTRVRELFSSTQAVGAAFGVILVRHRRSIVEVATFRAEGPYLDGRHPSTVLFTTAEQDAQRRDFTINGLFLDPVENRVIDYVGGQEDLRGRRLRAIGDPNARFEEDHLRMLRAVRFAARFGFTIDDPTAQAIALHAPQLKRISPERIAEELRMMLTPPTRIKAWPRLWELGLIDVIFRHIKIETAEAPDCGRSIFTSYLPQEPISFGEALAAATLCYRWQRAGRGDIRPFVGRAAASQMTRAMRQSLKISNQESDELQQMIESLGLLLDDQPPTLAQKKRFLAQLYSPGTMHLLEAVAGVGQHAARIRPLYFELTQLQAIEVSPPPLITGDDLIAQGLRPGKLFKRVLDAVYDAQLEDRVRTKDEAMDMALALATQV